jgi:hypothetical protein
MCWLKVRIALQIAAKFGLYMYYYQIFMKYNY